MKTTTAILNTTIALVLGAGLPTMAEAQSSAEARTQEARSQADQAQANAEAQRAEALQSRAAAEARVEAELNKALAEAERSRSEAQMAASQARAEIQKINQTKRQAERELNEERRAEFEAMRESLSRAHRELRESSRELSQINRELMFITQDGGERQIIISGGGQPVIGAILGDKNDAGVEVLGVSPSGPAEQAGLRAGDVIVAVAGRALVSVDKPAAADARNELNMALSEIEASEPVIFSIERGSETLDVKVVPEVREPLTWHSITRLPSVPAAPGSPTAPSAPTKPVHGSMPSVSTVPPVPPAATAPVAPESNVFIERIEVQELNRDELAAQIARMEVEIEQRGDHAQRTSRWVSGDTSGYEFYFGDMSELGDVALSDTSTWYGLPLTSGLRLAEVDPDLGAYFNTERGVLVLKVKPDNPLLLQAGDVVLSLQNTEVNSPADFMRALREFLPGDDLQINIKRDQTSQTLNPVIGDEQAAKQ